uniref:Sarcosine oxidasee (formaldehyde-forming) n=1 Tax=Rhabditophanes sp. KR3021 TaxID=114890 RepID=A0AC35TIJ5_9BILA
MYDCIVLGAGVMGSCAAYNAAKNRKKTLLLEQFSLDHKNGSSHGASRIIRNCHNESNYVKMAHRAFQLWDEMGHLGGETLYTSCGLLWLGDEEGTIKRSNLLKENNNVQHQILAGKQIRQKFPHLNYDEGNWHAVLDNQGGVIYAEKCLQTSQKLFKQFGGDIKENCKVVDVIPGSIIKVITEDGHTYETKQLIVAMGGWLNKLFPEIKIAPTPNLVSVNFWKLKKEFEDKEPLYNPDNLSPCLIIKKDDIDFFMLPGADFKGQVKFGIHMGESIDIDNKDRNVADWMHLNPAKHMNEHMSDIDTTKPEKIVMCVYQVTDDSNFILDTHPKYGKNIAFGSGFNGTGFKFGALIGEILNQIVDGKPINCCDMTFFSSTRVITEKNIH